MVSRIPLNHNESKTAVCIAALTFVSSFSLIDGTGLYDSYDDWEKVR